MAEGATSGGTDEVSNLHWNRSDWFKLVTSIIQFKRFTWKNQIKRGIHFWILTSLEMILKSTCSSSSCWALLSIVSIVTIVYSDGWNRAFRNSVFESVNFESVNPLRRKMIHCFKALQSDRVLRIIWFSSRLQSWFAIRAPSLDLKLWFANHYSDQDFGEQVHKSWKMIRESSPKLWSGFSNFLIQSGTSECVSQIIWFRSGLRSSFANLLIQIRTSVQVKYNTCLDQLWIKKREVYSQFFLVRNLIKCVCATYFSVWLIITSISFLWSLEQLINLLFDLFIFKERTIVSKVGHRLRFSSV